MENEAPTSPMTAARVLIGSPAERRTITLLTSNLKQQRDFSPPGTAWVQVQTPGDALALSVNGGAICSIITSTSATGQTGDEMCDRLTPCGDGIAVVPGSPIVLEYSRREFGTGAALASCGYVASATVTTNGSVLYMSAVVSRATIVSVGPPTRLSAFDAAAMAQATPSLQNEKMVRFVGNARNLSDLDPFVTLTVLNETATTTTTNTPSDAPSRGVALWLPGEAASCSWGNLRAYRLISLSTAAPPPDWVRGFTHAQCFGFASIPELQKACDADDDCLGYTSYFYNSDINNGSTCKEYPYCLLYADGDDDIEAIMSSAQSPGVIYALKPSSGDRSCAATLMAPRILSSSADRVAPVVAYSVWVMESYLSAFSSTLHAVDVFVDGRFVGFCPPLANGLRSLSSQCLTYVLCLTGRAAANSTVQAVASPRLAQGGCHIGAELVVMFDSLENSSTFGNSTASSAALAPVLVDGIEDFASQIISSRSQPRYRRFAFFIRNVQRLLLNVTQSVYGGAAPTANSSEQRYPRVVLRAGNFSLQCGTREGFFTIRESGSNSSSFASAVGLNNSNTNRGSGFSNQCELRLLCGDVLTLPTPMSGFVEVEIFDFDSVPAPACFRPFSAILLAAPPAAPHPPFGFALGSSVSAFKPLFGVSPPVSDPLTDSAIMRSAWPQVSRSNSAADLAVLSPAAVLNFNNFSWLSLRLNGTGTALAQQILMLPSHQTCIMDEITFFGGVCLMVIPKDANFATVTVLQSLAPGSSVQLVFFAGDAVVDEVSCLQDGEIVGTRLACFSYQSCYARFLPSNVNYLLVSVAQGTEQDPACDAALAVQAVFETRSTETDWNTSCSSTGRDDIMNRNDEQRGFPCPAKRQCLPATALCDGFKDCDDNSDEMFCANVFPVEVDTAFNSAAAEQDENGTTTTTTVLLTVGSVPSVAACRVKAVKYLLSSPLVDAPSSSRSVSSVASLVPYLLFSYSETLQICEFFSASFVRTGSSRRRVSFLTNVSAAVGTVIYEQLPNARSYSGCSRVASCSGHGSPFWKRNEALQTLTTEECQCACDPLFAGEHCDSFLSPKSTTAPFAVHVAVAQLADTSSIPLSRIERELEHFSRLQHADVRCGAFEEENATSVITLCKIQEETVAPELAVPAVNLLRQLRTASPALVMTAEQLTTTSYTKLANCNTVNLNTSSSVTSIAIECSGGNSSSEPQLLRWIKISTSAISAPVIEFRLQTGAERADDVSSSSSPQLVKCEPAVLTVSDDGCFLETCIVRLDQPFLLAALSVIVTFSSVSIDNDDCVGPIEILAYPSLTVIPLDGSVPLQTFTSTFIGYVIGAAFVFAVALFLAVRAFQAYLVSEAALRKRLRVAETALSDVIRMLREIFLRPMLEENNIIDKNRLAVIYAVGAYNLFAVAILLLLMYLTRISVTSNNFSALIELHSDRSCGILPTARIYTPFAAATVLSVPGGGCGLASIVGELPFPLYVEAICSQSESGEDGGGMRTFAAVRFGLSPMQCEAALPMHVANDTCVPVFGSLARVLCDNSAAVAARQAFLRALFLGETATGGSGAPSIPLLPLSRIQPTIVAQPLLPSRSSSALLLRPFLQSKRYPSSSVFPNRVASVASPDYLIETSGNSSFSRVIYQEPRALLSGWGGGDLVPPVSLSQLADLVRASLPLPAAGGFPLSGDMPVGYVFNGLSAGQAASKPSSSPRLRSVLSLPSESQTYLSMRRSLFDIGYYFGPSTIEDKLGFTISCYVRLREDSQGFIFALTDAIYDHDTLQSPLLAELEQFIVKSKSDSAWGSEYSSDALQVYLALYFSGSGKFLTLAAATPGSLLAPDEDGGKRVVFSSWSLEALGLEALANGAWHQLGVILRNDNGQVKAQLVVDGETSKSRPGWNLCWPRRPQPISSFTGPLSLRGTDSLSTVFSPDGMLTVGAISAAVAQLEFTNKVVAQGVMLHRGTDAMRAHVDLRRKDVLDLAIALLAIAAVFAVLTALSSGFAIAEGEEAVQEGFLEAVVSEFLDVVRYLVLEEEAPSAAAASPPGDQRSEYSRVGYEQARRWLNFTHAQMALFLDELKQNTARPHAELIRVLYVARVSQLQRAVIDPHTPMPPVRQWKWLLSKDAQDFEAELNKPAGWFGAAKQKKDFLHPAEGKLRLEESEGNVAFEESVSAMDRQADDDANDADDNARANSGGGGVVVDMGGGFGKTRGGEGGADSTTSQAGSGNSGASELTAQLYNMILPVITSLQTVYVWASSLDVSNDYLSSFGRLMSTISVDIASLARSLAPYATPLLQLLGATAICGMMYYLSVYDNEVFDWFLARYTLRRDERQRLINLRQQQRNSANGKKKKRQRRRKSSSSSAVSAAAMDELENAAKAAAPNSAPPAFAKSLLECEVISATTNIFARTPPCNHEYQLFVLPLRQAQRLDRFCEDANSSSAASGLDAPPSLEVVPPKESFSRSFLAAIGGQDKNNSKSSNVIDIEDSDGRMFTVTMPPLSIEDKLADLALMGRNPAAKCIISNPREPGRAAPATLSSSSLCGVQDDNTHQEGAALAAAPAASLACSSSIDVAGGYCRHHPNRLLSAQLQTAIWPFRDPPTCCIVSNGAPCGTSTGLIFSCGAIHVNDAGELAVCDFALCRRHCRFSPKELILSQFVALTRLVRQRGFRWAFAALLLILANAAYLPFIRTALMILACHPFYQCTFKCWENADQLFVVAAFLCLFVLVVFGVGLPALQSWLLRRRRDQFEVVFFSEEYQGAFLAKTSDIMKQLDPLTARKVFVAFITGQGLKYVVRKILLVLREMYGMVSKERVKGTANEHPSMEAEHMSSLPAKSSVTLSDADKKKDLLKKQQAEDEDTSPADRDVATDEWLRFLSCDPSALAVLYNTLELRYMFMGPILLLCKVVVIAPVVFLEPESYPQRLAMLCVEVLYALLIFGTAPFISPIVDGMYRLACIHQLLLLGLQNLDAVRTMDGQPSLAPVMVTASFVYLAICVGCMIYTSIYPALVQIRDVQKSDAMLRRLGLHFSMTTSLYVSPLGGERLRVKATGSSAAIADNSPSESARAPQLANPLQ
jgi:hypothetical protein